MIGNDRLHVTACASTNDLCAARARAGAAEGLVVTADAQTAGRGRLGRSWHSPPGENLYLSILLRPARPAHEIPPLTLLGGAAVVRAARAFGVAAELKWPNDVVVRDASADGGGGGGGRPRKVAGILTEASSEGARVAHVVMGIGINVDTTAFPPELGARVTSLRLARAAAAGDAGDAGVIGTARVLARVLEEVDAAYARYLSEGPAAAIALWEAEAPAGGTRYRVQIDGRELEADATGITNEGALVVRDDQGHTHRIVSGEVALI